MAVAVAAAFPLLVARMAYASQLPAADTNAAPIQVVAPAQVKLLPVPAKALQMSEAGMSDALIISYIQKSANSYTLDADQIIYLHDLGVSSAVLQALVEQEGASSSPPTAEVSSGMANMQNTSSTTGQSVPPVSGEAANFYDALAPYGTWMDVPAYGWCWQPTVEVVNSDWQPYSNNGGWLWTDQGWYWNSYYSWGWAPFHYGRWCQYPGYGWLWCPDDVWGPAWVCWRDYPGYCGWAPLPPGAYFTSGVGWTFNGLAVGFNYGFGLGSGCFTFCDYDNFCRRHEFHHFLHGRDADRFFDHSRVDNDFALDAHHRFTNRGIDPSRIEAATHTRIGQVAVREFPHGAEHNGGFTMPDRLAQNGDTRVIYRPSRDLSVMRNHFQHGGLLAHHWGGENAAHGFTGERTFGNPRQFQPARPNERHPSVPVAASNHSSLNTFNNNQHWGAVANPQANHFLPAQTAPNYHRGFPNSRRYTQAWHSAPATHPASSWHSTAPAWHSSAPAVRPTPAFHSAPPFRAAPAFHPAPTFHPAPAFNHPVPTWHPAPAWHPSAPAVRPAPAFHSAPAFHAAPAFHPAPPHGGGGRHFGGGRHR
ncbi:MAG: DUF6600 domain-containing protein [Limisphaerales bacterium]